MHPFSYCAQDMAETRANIWHCWCQSHCWCCI